MLEEKKYMSSTNVKKFVSYLSHIMSIFEEYIDEKEFDNPNSDICKLFVALMKLYTDLYLKKHKIDYDDIQAYENNCKEKVYKTKDLDSPENMHDLCDENIKNYIDNRKRLEPEIKKFSKGPSLVSDSDEVVRRLHMNDLCNIPLTSTHEPIRVAPKEKQKGDKFVPKIIVSKDVIEDSIRTYKYPIEQKGVNNEMTEDIDIRISKLKKMLNIR